MSSNVSQRTCSTCKRELPETAFYRNRAQTYNKGFEYRCKDCERERARWRNLLRLYGLTRDDYEAMLVAQDGRCATCEHAPGPGEVLDVDHDHVTGLNRGLLCRWCNVVLGMVRESPERLERLAVYLRANAMPEED